MCSSLRRDSETNDDSYTTVTPDPHATAALKTVV